MLIVRNLSSSFSYNMPRDAFLSSVRFGLRVASRRRDRNMDDVPAGGAIPPPSKPNTTTSANLTAQLLGRTDGRRNMQLLWTQHDAVVRTIFIHLSIYVLPEVLWENNVCIQYDALLKTDFPWF